MEREYDVVVLGGGTGGYVAAIRASQLGLKTALVDKEKVGGTCLHKGCIPTKALLKSAEVYVQTKHEAASYGVETSNVSLNFSSVQERKERIVEQLHQGVASLIKKGEIDFFEGTGRMLGPSIFSPMPGTISVEFSNGNENEMLVLKNLIIATGSRPKRLPGLAVDEKHIMTSDGALQMESLPTSIIIVGAGVIGIEWASMLTDFGVDVTVIESGQRILPMEDEAISSAMQKALEKKGVSFVLNAQVKAETAIYRQAAVTVDVLVKEENMQFEAEKLLVSVGRLANIEDIGLVNTEIEVKDGYIMTSPTYQTKEQHIYAIGDVIGGLQLAHVASHEGIAAVEHIANVQREPIDDTKVARCIYSSPEVASIGLTEQQATEQGYVIKVGQFPFRAIGKALINGQSDGFVKMIADAETEDLLGVHMIGSHVTELISEASLASVLDATPWEIASTIHPHPSLSEVFGEVALAVDKKAIHL